MLKSDITNIVLEILKEKGYQTDAIRSGTLKPTNLVRPGPKVLHIFHAGVRKLELAKKQVGLIEKKTGRSRIYTVDSARSWVCGADIKEESGRCCNIDKISPEGLEKILAKSDILVLPTLNFKTANYIARMRADSLEVDIVISALMRGKKVLAANDGFKVESVVLRRELQKEIDLIFSKLESFGIIFCATRELSQRFTEMFEENQVGEADSEKRAVPEVITQQEYSFISTKEIQIAVDKKWKTLRLAPKGVVTPLARDHARERSIRIV